MRAQIVSSKPSVQWNTVWVGVLIGMVAQLLMVLLSLVAELSGLSVSGGRKMGGEDVFILWSASLWQGFSMMIAAFLGAYTAGRILLPVNKALGYLHGFMIGVVMVLLFAFFSSTKASMWLGGVFHNTAFIISQVSPLVAPPQSAERTLQLEVLLKTNVAESEARPITGQMTREWQIQVEAGEREKAMAYLVHSFGFSNTRAALLTDQALMLVGNVERASLQERLRTQGNLNALSEVSWTILITVCASLFFASFGGMLGAIDEGGAVSRTFRGKKLNDSPY